MTVKENKSKALIPVFEHMDITVLEDYLLVTAAGIERALMACNADYTALDLIQLAHPYALERWKNGTLTINGRLLEESPVKE